MNFSLSLLVTRAIAATQAAKFFTRVVFQINFVTSYLQKKNVIRLVNWEWNYEGLDLGCLKKSVILQWAPFWVLTTPASRAICGHQSGIRLLYH